MRILPTLASILDACTDIYLENSNQVQMDSKPKCYTSFHLLLGLSKPDNNLQHFLYGAPDPI